MLIHLVFMMQGVETALGVTLEHEPCAFVKLASCGLGYIVYSMWLAASKMAPVIPTLGIHTLVEFPPKCYQGLLA